MFLFGRKRLFQVSITNPCLVKSLMLSLCGWVPESPPLQLRAGAVTSSPQCQSLLCAGRVVLPSSLSHCLQASVSLLGRLTRGSRELSQPSLHSALVHARMKLGNACAHLQVQIWRDKGKRRPRAPCWPLQLNLQSHRFGETLAQKWGREQPRNHLTSASDLSTSYTETRVHMYTRECPFQINKE